MANWTSRGSLCEFTLATVLLISSLKCLSFRSALRWKCGQYKGNYLTLENLGKSVRGWSALESWIQNSWPHILYWWRLTHMQNTLIRLLYAPKRPHKRPLRSLAWLAYWCRLKLSMFRRQISNQTWNPNQWFFFSSQNMVRIDLFLPRPCLQLLIKEVVFMKNSFQLSHLQEIYQVLKHLFPFPPSFSCQMTHKWKMNSCPSPCLCDEHTESILDLLVHIWSVKINVYAPKLRFMK